MCRGGTEQCAAALSKAVRGMEGELTTELKLEDTVTDERVGLFTPDKDRCTADGMGRAAVIAARRGTVCGEVGRVLRFWSTQHPHTPFREAARRPSPVFY